MTGPQGSSFIPKQPASGNVRRPKVRRVYVLAYVSFVLFFGTLVAAAGTFFYKVSVEAQLQSVQDRFVEERELFSQADIARVRALSDRIAAAESLLNNHISALSVIEVLESSIVSSIQLDGLSLMLSDAGQIEISIPATTKKFNPVLIQKEIIASNPVLAGAEVIELSGEASSEEEAFLSSEEDLNVSFVIEKTVSPSDLLWQPRIVTFNENITNTVIDSEFTESFDDTAETVEDDITNADNNDLIE